MNPTSTTSTTSSERRVQRVRHELERRPCTVQAVTRLSPGVVRVRFADASLTRFISLSFDDHLKLMLPAGPSAGDAPVMRDFTPRAYDNAAGTLDIEFALHGHGPAALWAAHAAPGQPVTIGGPRGSLIIPMDYDWYLLVGDESALPAIARRLEELPATSRVWVLAETAEPADRRELRSAAQVELRWLQTAAKGQPSALAEAVAGLNLPAGEGYAWAAGEASAIAAVRQVLVHQHGLPKERIRAASYWKPGAAGHHENLES